MKSLTLVSFSLHSSCLWLLFALSLCTLCLCNHQKYYSDKIQCLATERLVLIEFKNSLVDTANRLSSWSGDDCCSWSGVVCDNFTHHVHELRLHGPCYGSYDSYGEYEEAMKQMLGGMISPCLIKLQQLRYLDLSCNNFGFIPIPSFIGSLQNLRYLNISRSVFGGEIPHQLGNLSALLVLDVHYNILRSENLKWMENLKQLQYLDMSGVNLTGASSDWLQAINTLSSLQEMHLSGCGLTQIPSEPTKVSFISLIVLDLSYNFFYGGLLPEWVFSLRKLITLDLSRCFIGVASQGGLDSMHSLRTLRLSSNTFVNTSSFLNGLSGLSNLRDLDVSNCSLVDPVLVKLQNLSLIVHLDLSNNSFVEEIPKSLSNLCNLKTLHLQSNTFFGNVSELLERFCECESPKLESLALGFNSLTGQLPEKLGRLKNLANIDMAYNMLTGTLPPSLGSLPLLKVLYLDSNQLEGSIPDSVGDLSSLEYFALANNRLNGSLPESIGKLGKLIDLILRNNSLTGTLPRSLGSLSLLKVLSLYSNQLEGSIPDSIGDLSSLEYLGLAYNRLNGSLPESIGKLGKLSTLMLDHNSLTGIVTENHFANLTALETLKVGYNKLAFDIVNNWIPPFQLEGLLIGNCNLGPLFPPWVQSQKNLVVLDLANANISDTIPNWFWSTFSSLLHLNISHNNITGKLEDVSTSFAPEAAVLDLSSNHFHGELSHTFSKADFGILDLSSNNLFGSLDQFLCFGVEEPRKLVVLNLANNNMSGGLPDCWMNWENLAIVNLEKNKFSGKMPSSLGNISSLESLDIRNNKLSGEIPMSLFNSKSLLIVKLAENELTGRIPASIGSNGTSLKILSLRSNKLSGEIPNELCRLSSIQILDLADNNLSGYLPKCFTNCSVFSGKEEPTDIAVYQRSTYNLLIMNQQPGSISLVIKGQFYSYTTIVFLVTALDLSKNNFSGSIPNELVSLPGLRFLNLSRNRLTGRIPNTLGEMRELESLDLSLNLLQGTIPLSLAGLTALSLLNVSYNNLTGTIPTGRQLQTFNESCFIGNALCGAPLAACRPNSDDTNISNDDDDDDKVDGIDWILVICMIAGLAVGFWITIGTLIISKQWRYAYYGFLDQMRIKLANFILLVSMRILHRTE